MSRKNNPVYPIDDRKNTFLEKLALDISLFPIRCNICSSLTYIHITNDNFRENCFCHQRNSFNRQRQIVYLICQLFKQKDLISLSKLHEMESYSIYNTECDGVLHKYLSRFPQYTCSEYFGPHDTVGKFVNKKPNEDLAHLSFQNEMFNLVISSDIFEHIPDPYLAHQEVYRVLKINGRHIFTVPFYQNYYLDERRALINENNEIQHLKEPIFHIDPLRKDGILVFNIFSLEMLTQLAKIGFRTKMHLLTKPFLGIFGQNAILFEAIKV